MLKLMNGFVVVGMAMLLVASCSTDDHRGGFQRFLTDPEDLNEFPVNDRRQLREEYNRLPKSMMVRIPTDNDGNRIPERAEARYYDQRLDFDSDNAPMHHQMHQRWSQGRDSDRLAIAHHMSHMVDHREFKKHRKFHKRHHRNYGWHYNYTPYYRSSYNSNYWWNSYTFYRSYPYNGYEYCIYYPRSYAYSYYPRSYFNYYSSY